MAKLVDALDLGSSGETHQSSSLCMPTISILFARITILTYGVCEAAQHACVGQIGRRAGFRRHGETHQRAPSCMPTISILFARITILTYGVCERNKKPTNVGLYLDSITTIAAQ